jgi:hypothetical protein
LVPVDLHCDTWQAVSFEKSVSDLPMLVGRPSRTEISWVTLKNAGEMLVK